MSDLTYDIQGHLALITLNRPNKHNAFDKALLAQMHDYFKKAIDAPNVRVIVLKAEGRNFSAGADLAWMQSMANFSLEDNKEDAMVLAKLMTTIYQSPKPTLAVIQGCAYGGGAGLAAACDIAIAATSARFCFSEVTLGLIPAVISPFVVKAIGARATKALFMSAEVFDAPRALALNLIQHCVPEENLLEFSLNYATNIANNAPESVKAAKALVDFVAHKTIDETLEQETATLIANKRVSEEGQKGLKAFLNKESPNWN
ncbi:MAG: enoyl-CoA hydratase-related protein [Legionellales bacterium]